MALGVSPAKIKRLLPIAGYLDILFANRDELATLTELGLEAGMTDYVRAAATLGIRQVVATDGTNPVTVGSVEACIPIPVNVDSATDDQTGASSTRSVNGAGDALAGTTVGALLNRAMSLEEATRQGIRAAATRLDNGWVNP